MTKPIQVSSRNITARPAELGPEEVTQPTVEVQVEYAGDIPP